MTTSRVLAALNASTYWEVRLGISLAAALLDGHFEQPAMTGQAIQAYPSYFLQILMIPHGSRGCQRLNSLLGALEAGHFGKQYRDEGKGQPQKQLPDQKVSKLAVVGRGLNDT